MWILLSWLLHVKEQHPVPTIIQQENKRILSFLRSTNTWLWLLWPRRQPANYQRTNNFVLFHQEERKNVLTLFERCLEKLVNLDLTLVLAGLVFDLNLSPFTASHLIQVCEIHGSTWMWLNMNYSSLWHLCRHFISLRCLCFFSAASLASNPSVLLQKEQGPLAASL